MFERDLYISIRILNVFLRQLPNKHPHVRCEGDHSDGSRQSISSILLVV